MPAIITSIRAEYSRYKALAEGAIVQLDDQQIGWSSGAHGLSIAAIVWHLHGNLTSRFTDFLTTDGEKPTRDRDGEFAPRVAPRAEVLARWEQGWQVLFATLDGLDDSMLERTVTIRLQPLLVQEALLRSLAHVSYHVGQIVLIAKTQRSGDWQYLSIPPGLSAAYNQNPGNEKADGHAAKLSALRRRESGPA